MRNHAWAKLWNSDLHGSFEVAYCTTDESSDAPDYLGCTQKERRLWVDSIWAQFHRIQLSLVLEFSLIEMSEAERINHSNMDFVFSCQLASGIAGANLLITSSSTKKLKRI